ncbi:MAG: type I 3-dehydroquinate dehydratase [Thermodesulfobacteriota bacterium]|nr:MAG: type I 3-dehydroquinate dehydratase [Thermodesulfobacteriota bacterium]
MFCITLAEKDIKALEEKIKIGSQYSDFFELRIDALKNPQKLEIKNLLKFPYKFLFTFRSYKEGGFKKIPEKERLDWILWALKEKFYLVDVELYFLKRFFNVLSKIKGFSEKILVSYHNFEKVPSLRKLKAILSKIQEYKIKKAKIVCMCNSLRDSFRLLDLIYEAKSQSISLISFGMGEEGKLSRILCLLCGSPYTYVILPEHKEVAPGQMDILTAQKLYKKFRCL